MLLFRCVTFAQDLEGYQTESCIGIEMNEEQDGRGSVAVILARWGMTAAVVAFFQTVLFNPAFGLALPLLRESLWPVAIRVAGIILMVAVPTGVVLSGIGLCVGGLQHRKGVLLPGALGIILGLFTGVPFSFGFLHASPHAIPRANAQELPPKSMPSAPPVQVAMIAPRPPAPTVAGVFIPAPQRVDMIHDLKRNRLYITAGDSLLQYQMDSKTLLPPITLGGNLRGLDISPDGDWLAIADSTADNGRIWIFLMDLRAQTNSRVTFHSQSVEAGTYSVAFGADGGVWVTSTLSGSGFAPLRKYTPKTRTSFEAGSVSKNTMLTASADHKMLALAQANSSPGSYGQFGYRAVQLPNMVQAKGFVYEIGISRDGTQMVVPVYDQVYICGSPVSQLPERECIGVVYHPQRDFVFLAQAGSSLIEAYDSRTFAKVKELDFGSKFEWRGGKAFEDGRLRMSNDGALLFCTVMGGIRYMETGL
jgi:hypothetical protein